MAKENIGESIIMEPDCVYIRVAAVKGDVNMPIQFTVLNTLDPEEDLDLAQFMTCLARGMIETTIQNPEEVIDVGLDAFIRESMDNSHEVSVDGLKPVSSGGDDDDGPEKPKLLDLAKLTPVGNA